MKIVALAFSCLGWTAVSLTGRPAAADPAPAVTYVGEAVCAGCHAKEAEAWRGSHHALAMQVAKDGTVLGDFNDGRFTSYGVTSHFFRRDGKPFVNTDGRDGKLADFEIKYTFGVYPLQQYLVDFPDGRLQALSIAWDARPKAQGGQRRFHLYPDDPIRHDDPLHWTGLEQNWNFRCAECHSTDVHKNYDAAKDRYHTTWSDIDVACEACHGAGSRHVAWANHANADPDKGLVVAFEEHDDAGWTIDPATGNARRSALQPLRTELETCGLCHSRAAELSEDWHPGHSLSDTHLVALLEPGLYYADGQIEDEVYEYGSFRQSKMFSKGVTCTDCHEPHNLQLRAKGDGVCLQCHMAAKYETAAHSFHGKASPPIACISCHMPNRTYMRVHVRHDHSFRIPRPDRSVRLGTPNACNACHRDKSAQWAADAIERWHGPERMGYQHFADTLHAARAELPESAALLHRVANDPKTPGIAAATAYAEMPRYLTPSLVADLKHGLADPDPLVRIGALRGLDGVAPDQRWAFAGALLTDPALAVRTEAVSLLAAAPTAELSAEDRQRFDHAAQEYIRVQRFNADRPEARVTLGAFYAERGEAAKAEAEYRAAIKLAPHSVPAYVNLADLYRGLGRDSEGETLLREALAIDRANADVHYALGLLLVREHKLAEAAPMLAKATELDPGRAHYAYVYAIALNSAGQQDQARHVLEESHKRHPADRETLTALISLARDAGDQPAAAHWAELLARLDAGETSDR
jgi:predicted CXXCH cytochrome family protein